MKAAEYILKKYNKESIVVHDLNNRARNAFPKSSDELFGGEKSEGSL